MATPAKSSTPPAGYNLVTAKTLAPQVNSDLAKKYNYSRPLLKQFQTAAGIAADGIYGGGARGALIFFGIPNAPPALFKPTATAPYPWTNYVAAQLGAPIPAAPKAAPKAPAPAQVTKTSATPKVAPKAAAKPAPVAASTIAGAAPAKGFSVSLAKSLAPKVNSNLVAKKAAGYDHSLLKQFQVAAGIAADGLYGGGARGALIYYGIANPPQPFFKPTATTSYPWAAYLQNVASQAALKKALAAQKAAAAAQANAQKIASTPAQSLLAPAPTAAVPVPAALPASNPIATPDQTQEYEPPVAASTAVAPASGPSGPSASQAVVTPPNADSDAPAPAAGSGPGSSNLTIGLAVVAIGAMAFLGYKAIEKPRRVYRA